MPILHTIRAACRNAFVALCLGLLGASLAGLSGCSPEGAPSSQRFAAAIHPTAISTFGLCKPGRFRGHDLVGGGIHFAREMREKSVLLEQDDAGFERWQTPLGTYWVVKGNFGTTSRLLGERQVDIYRLRSSMGIREGDIVLDGGAHFGVFARTALDLGAKLVVAIEIAPENIEVLRRTFASEIADGSLIVYPKGIWDKDDELVLERSEQTWGHHVAGHGHEPEGEKARDETQAETRVPLTTIDKIVAELELPRVDFIKLDVEGAERKALLGAAETLAEFRPRMAIAAYHEPDDLDAIPQIALDAQPAYQLCLSGVGGGWGNLSLNFE